jgi:hypothetical protein
VKPLGQPYDLGDGTRLIDLDAACSGCGKRLAEVLHDSTGVWHAGQVVCLDCGQVHRNDYCRARHPRHGCRCEYRRHGPEKQHMARHRTGVAVWSDAA